MTERERIRDLELTDITNELCALEARLHLLSDYASAALEVGDPNHGLALYLAEEASCAKALSQRMLELP